MCRGGQEHGNPTHDPATFSSQSTFILPNPAYVPGKQPALAPYIYMADRWETNTSWFGRYLWLPLTVDPHADLNQTISVTNPPSWRYDQPPPSTSPLKADDEVPATTRGVEHAALTVRVDASKTSAFDTMWRECVGSGHAALWSRADWREHIRMVSTEIGFHYLRGHGILDNAVM